MAASSASVWRQLHRAMVDDDAFTVAAIYSRMRCHHDLTWCKHMALQLGYGRILCMFVGMNELSWEAVVDAAVENDWNVVVRILLSDPYMPEATRQKVAHRAVQQASKLTRSRVFVEVLVRNGRVRTHQKPPVVANNILSISN